MELLERRGVANVPHGACSLSRFVARVSMAQAKRFRSSGITRSCPVPGMLSACQAWPRIIDTGPGAPCWTEEIGRDDRYVYARSECVDDALMELDDRARRGAFPFEPGG